MFSTLQSLLYTPIARAAYEDVLMQRVNKYFLNPIITVIFVAGLVQFLVGVIQFLSNTENEEKRTAGKQHMLWGLLGMFIMIAVFFLMGVLTHTLGNSSQVDVNTGQVNLQ